MDISFNTDDLNNNQVPVLGEKGTVVAYYVQDFPMTIDGKPQYALGFLDKEKKPTGYLAFLADNRALLLAENILNAYEIKKPDFAGYPAIFAQVFAEGKDRLLRQLAEDAGILATNPAHYYATMEASPCEPMDEYLSKLKERIQKKREWLGRN